MWLHITIIHSAAPIRASLVKRAYGPGPVTTSCRPGWADYSSGSFLAGARVFPPRGQGSSWSARSRAAARTNELGRRQAAGDPRGRGRAGCGSDCQGSRVGSRRVADGVVSQAPIRRRVKVRAAAMTMCPGSGLLSHVIERGAGAGSCRRSELTRGLATLGFTAAAAVLPRRRLASGTAGARRGSAACGRSRWWRSSSRAGWRWPRSWRRTPGTAWQSARPRARSSGPRPSPAYLCSGVASTGGQVLAARLGAVDAGPPGEVA